MSFGSINQFGSLTVNGRKLTFEDFDKDKNGEISTEEYNALLNEVKLDTVELSTIDKNGDQVLSTEEFGAWEQKIAMQDAVNAMAGQISKDFTGKTQYLAEVKTALQDFIEEFAKTYTGDAAGMVDAFKEALPKKYAEIKAAVLANDPQATKSKVLDEVYTELTAVPADGSGEALPPATAKRIATELENEADKFIKAYKGTNLEADLKAHLEAFLSATESVLMKDASANFKAGTEGLGPVFDSNDLSVVKEYAKEFLQAALDNGITVKLGGVNIKTTAAIATALRKFDDAEELMNAINDVISNFSTVSRKEQIIAEEKVKAEEAAFKEFASIKGSEYAVEPGLIDWSKVDPRYFDGGDIYQRGKGWSGSRDKAYNEGFAILTADGLKNQIKAQIEAMLKEKGIPFDKIAQVFENVYNQTAQDTLNAEGMITGRGARGLSSKGKAYIDVKTLCDTFVTNFNTNIAKAIDEMNASNKDMDTVDLDYSGLNTDENGNPIAENGEDFAALYASGQTVTVKKKGADYYVKIAEQLINKMKAQMLSKAQNMCAANGIEFDQSVFDTMFNNAKMTAINAGVSGVSADGTKWGGIAGGSAGAIASGAAGVVASEVVATAGLLGFKGALSTAFFLTGPTSWIIGGALALGGILASAFGFGGRSSQSSLNTKVLMDTFTEQFKTNFSAWVEQEKAEQKNV